MLLYLAIIFISFLLTSLDFFQLRAKGKLLFYVPFVFILILLASLRPSGIDRDYDSYRTAYGYMAYLDWKNMLNAYSIYQLEPGYIFLTKIFYSIGFSFAAFLFVFELAMGLVLACLIHKYSPYPFTSLLLYVCLFYFLRNFTQIRFAFSSILLLAGLIKIAENKKTTGYFILILSGLIHNSAWVGIIVAISYNLFYNRWLYLIIAPFGYLIGLFHPLELIFSFMGLPKQLTRYFSSNMEIGASVMSSFFNYALLAIAILNYETLRDLFGKKFEYMYIAGAFGVFIGLMFIQFPIMQRISGGLFTSVIFLVPYLIKMLTERKWYGYREIFALSVIIVFSLYGIKLILISHILKPYF